MPFYVQILIPFFNGLAQAAFAGHTNLLYDAAGSEVFAKVVPGFGSGSNR